MSTLQPLHRKERSATQLEICRISGTENCRATFSFRNRGVGTFLFQISLIGKVKVSIKRTGSCLSLAEHTTFCLAFGIKQQQEMLFGSITFSKCIGDNPLTLLRHTLHRTHPFIDYVDKLFSRYGQLWLTFSLTIMSSSGVATI